jgi:hypothetical protein
MTELVDVLVVVAAVVENLTAGWRRDAGNRVQERGLAGAAAADDGDKLSRLDGEANVTSGVPCRPFFNFRVRPITSSSIPCGRASASRGLSENARALTISRLVLVITTHALLPKRS